MLQYQPARQDVPTGTMVAQQLWVQATAFWITHKVYSIGIHAWYCKRGQRPMVRDVIGRGEPMTVILPSGNVFKLLSKYMCLYCRLVLLNLIQRNISL